MIVLPDFVTVGMRGTKKDNIFVFDFEWLHPLFYLRDTG